MYPKGGTLLAIREDSLPTTITITNQTRRKINLRQLKTHLTAALKLQSIPAGSWSITLVNDRTMADLHARTMNLPTTTDVLTFDLRDESEKSPLDLDTVICADEAHRQATARNHPLDHEILLYAIHSLLHVCNYNDDTSAHSARMHRREDVLLTQLGVGPVYHIPPAS